MRYAVANVTQLVHQALPTHPRQEDRLEELPSTGNNVEKTTDVEICKGIPSVS
jgi:hypothetical protein